MQYNSYTGFLYRSIDGTNQKFTGERERAGAKQCFKSSGTDYKIQFDMMKIFETTENFVAKTSKLVHFK